MIHVNNNKNVKKHVWVVRLKHVLLAIFTFLIGILLLSRLQPNSNFSKLLQANFTQMNYSGFLIAKPLFYIFFEEFAFRAALKPTRYFLGIAAFLVLFLSINQFPGASLSFYLFSVYGLFLLIQFNKNLQTKFILGLHYLLSLSALNAFHLLKFDLREFSIDQLILTYLLPITMLGTMLFWQRLKHPPAISLLTYLFIYLLSSYV